MRKTRLKVFERLHRGESSTGFKGKAGTSANSKDVFGKSSERRSTSAPKRLRPPSRRVVNARRGPPSPASDKSTDSFLESLPSTHNSASSGCRASSRPRARGSDRKHSGAEIGSLREELRSLWRHVRETESTRIDSVGSVAVLQGKHDELVSKQQRMDRRLQNHSTRLHEMDRSWKKVEERLSEHIAANGSWKKKLERKLTATATASGGSGAPSGETRSEHLGGTRALMQQCSTLEQRLKALEDDSKGGRTDVKRLRKDHDRLEEEFSNVKEWREETDRAVATQQDGLNSLKDKILQCARHEQQLAEHVRRLHDNVAANADVVSECRFRMDAVHERQTRVERNVETVDTRVSTLESRMKSLEEGLSSMRADAQKQKEAAVEIEKRCVHELSTLSRNAEQVLDATSAIVLDKEHRRRQRQAKKSGGRQPKKSSALVDTSSSDENDRATAKPVRGGQRHVFPLSSSDSSGVEEPRAPLEEPMSIYQRYRQLKDTFARISNVV